MPYMVTFTINIPQMLAYIPYMDPMGLNKSMVKLSPWILGTCCSVLSAHHQTFGATSVFWSRDIHPKSSKKTPLITQIRLRRTKSSKFVLSLHFYPFFVYLFHCGNGLERQLTHNEPHWSSEQNGAIVVEIGPARKIGFPKKHGAPKQ